MAFSFIAPIMFTGSSSRWDFTSTGQIGDTIGGISSPFIAIGGVIMTFLAFYMQVRANKLQSEQFFKSLNTSVSDDKIDCHYKLQLIKNDLEKAVSDIDDRINSLERFKESQLANPYRLNVLTRKLLINHYYRLLSMDKLSVYKGFRMFLSSTEGWRDKFNNLYNGTDFIPEAFKDISDSG